MLGLKIVWYFISNCFSQLSQILEWIASKSFNFSAATFTAIGERTTNDDELFGSSNKNSTEIDGRGNGNRIGNKLQYLLQREGQKKFSLLWILFTVFSFKLAKLNYCKEIVKETFSKFQLF